MHLDYLGLHGDENLQLLSCMVIRLIAQKCSAALERDFKAMRHILESTTKSLSTDSLNRRLRLALNVPSMQGPEANAFLCCGGEQNFGTEGCFWSGLGIPWSSHVQSITETSQTATPKPRGRPRGALGKNKRQHTGRGCLATQAQAAEGGDITNKLIDVVDDDPLKYVQAICGFKPIGQPANDLLAAVKKAAVERSEAVAQAQKDFEASKAEKKNQWQTNSHGCQRRQHSS